jgi:uncharacterized membrane protein YedE/YeeE
MTQETKSLSGQYVVACVAGMVFSLGLGLSGMTLPTKVIGFLDVTGDWDGSLAFVMGGAVVVYALAYRWSLRMERPKFASRFQIPVSKHIDAKLLIGAGMFGVGWGLGGFCPGPALVSLAAGVSGVTDIVVFVVCMMLGMWGFRAFEAVRGT